MNQMSLNETWNTYGFFWFTIIIVIGSHTIMWITGLNIVISKDILFKILNNEVK